MIQRRTFIKRTPLKKHAPKKREGFVDEPYKAWLRTWPCYVCLRAVCAGETGSYQFWKVIEDVGVRSGFVPFLAAQCGATQAAHVGTRGLAQKCRDREAMPLGQKHHLHQTAGGGPESHHTLGAKFWDHHGLERQTVISILQDLYHRETGK